MNANFFELKNHTLVSLNAEVIVTDKGTFTLYHEQDCCESVGPVEIVGDVNAMLNQKVVLAEEDANSEELNYGSKTTTIFTIRCENGMKVKIVWEGESNGYYSESVSVKYEAKTN